MRLIDADALGVGRCSRDILPDAYCAGWNGLIHIINSAPTINPADIRPQGRWITHDNGITECSECHTLGSPQWKCCPVCTAMMDGKENEDA